MTDKELVEAFSLFECMLVTGEFDGGYYKNLIVNRYKNHVPSREYVYMFLGFAGGVQLGLKKASGVNDGRTKKDDN